jgi:hypothetical protein
MYFQVWDGDMFLFYCDKYDVDSYAEQGYNVVTEAAM